MVPVNNYKILFYFTEPFNPSKGGVERVSIVLGKWLTENGCTIFYLSNKCVVEKNSLNHIYLPQDGGLKRKENWAFFKEFILNLKSASNLNDNLNCSKELEHYAS